MTITGNFERFQNVNFEKHFLKNYNFFKKKLEDRFLVQSTINQKRMLRQKPMLRQIEWRVRNGPITKNGRLPLTTSFF